MGIITDLQMNQSPKENDIWLTDNAPRGAGRFCARITPDKRRLFYFKYTSAPGKREYVPLGAYDKNGKTGLTLEEARKKAGALSLLYKSGVMDIKGHLETERLLEEARRNSEMARLEAERKAAELEASRLTVLGLFEKWGEVKLSKRKDGKEIRRIFNKDVFPEIGHLQAHTIRKGHILAITDRIESRGAARLARLVFTNLRTMFKYGAERELIEVDPTATLRKANIGEDSERERYLSDGEIRLLVKQLPKAELPASNVAAIWISIATCCRIGELLTARWEHVDLENRRWFIPSPKNKVPFEIYLSDFAIKQFRIIDSERKRIAEKLPPEEQQRRSKWLYPARNKKQGDTHIDTKAITKQVTDRQKLNIQNKRTSNTGTLCLPDGKWTIHDLRRTGSTLMGAIGVIPEVIDRCQNHKEPNRLKRIYQRHNYKSEMQRAWVLLGEKLETLTHEQSVAKVIPIRANSAAPIHSDEVRESKTAWLSQVASSSSV